MTDYYEILDCSVDSTLEEIRHAYHKLALRHHPDKSNESEMFTLIEKAWRVLGDADSRKEYDARRRQNDLEDMSVLLYARISSKELEECGDPDSMKYSCRCGGHYRIKKIDLVEMNCILRIPCPECTFSLEIET